MVQAAFILRAAATLLLFDVGMMHDDTHQEAHETERNTLRVFRPFDKKIPKNIGIWSPWSLWSPCSRSCGGGVTQQTRNCVNRPADSRFMKRQRRRRQVLGCVGLYKRIHLCNTQPCPLGSDFRVEQCSMFNTRPFKGKLYQWEPFLRAPNQCALNCRPSGMDFYAVLNKTVLDGTSCDHPVTSYGRAAPMGTRGVCIDGYCKSVSANGIVGSADSNREECPVCVKGTCRSISGLYTRPDLPQGYSLVAQIPKGACSIQIQQLKHTRNFLALKNTNGSYILNGDWRIGAVKSADGAGTKFHYVKQDAGDNLETITSIGPLTNPVDIMILNYQTNPGVRYSYSLPVDDTNSPRIAPPLLKRAPELPRPGPELPAQHDDPRHTILQRRTRLRRRFSWKISGISACSKSCGGGLQAIVVTCVREHTQTPVPDRKCQHLPRPATQPIRCNVQDCPPTWESQWSMCSVTCGTGVEERSHACQQVLTVGRILTLDDDKCPSPKPTPETRQCNLEPCDKDNELVPNRMEKEWSVGAWSQCTVTCGTGHRTRSVTCPDGRCDPQNRPKYVEYCENSPCSLSQHVDTSPSPWLATEWSQCTESCGTGTQIRYALCFHQNCSESAKPQTSRACSSEKQCHGQWFAGPWEACSDSCSSAAKQSRSVVCVVKIRGQSHVTNDMTCSSSAKPETERPCAGICPPKWFLGDWSECICPSGVQKREVRCLGVQGQYSTSCEGEMPSGKRQCACQDQNRPAHDQPSADMLKNSGCEDSIRNCYLAVQARLCQYPYYAKQCCVSCKRAQPDTADL